MFYFFFCLVTAEDLFFKSTGDIACFGIDYLKREASLDFKEGNYCVMQNKMVLKRET